MVRRRAACRPVWTKPDDPGVPLAIGSVLRSGEAMKQERRASPALCSRRLFLGFGLVVAGGFISPAARAAMAVPRKLSFLHTHTGETLTATYWQNGMYEIG